MYLLFALKLEAVYDFGLLLAKIPQMEDIIGGCGYESALVNEKLDLNDGAIALVPDVDIHTGASQSKLLVKETNGVHKKIFIKMSREKHLTYERKFKISQKPHNS